MTDQELMQKIHDVAGAILVGAADKTSVPEAFLAALVANETGKEFAEGGLVAAAQAKRFEPGVLADLWQVLMGRKMAYGSIGRTDLLRYVTGLPAIPINVPVNIPSNALNLLDGLATSWGITQIMGYHAMEAALFAQPAYANRLLDPETDLDVTTKMLAQFAAHFSLDLAKDFADLFRCWNTGSPSGKTFDPNYVPNGLKRMQLYDAVAAT